eukprot:13588156-Heterocapsa_arctica.AAC.1
MQIKAPIAAMHDPAYDLKHSFVHRVVALAPCPSTAYLFLYLHQDFLPSSATSATPSFHRPMREDDILGGASRCSTTSGLIESDGACP